MPTDHPATTDVQSLTLKFALAHSRAGAVTAFVKADNDPSKYGLQLILPNENTNTLQGFPVCEATVSTIGTRGYGSIYGWIQMVRSGGPSNISGAPWEMDPIPILADLNTPFAWFGPEPKLFDAPIRIGVQDLDWTCHSFLTYIEDGLMSKDVKPVLGFEWGFELHNGTPKLQILRELHLSAWNEQLDLLERSFTGWKFNRYQDENGS
ncbi:hypothetical protein MBLNU13_g07955t1 [Cladosporium sp. NU13]